MVRLLPVAVNKRRDRHPDLLRQPENADSDAMLGQRLAKQCAGQRRGAVVERDNRVAAQERGPEALLGFLLVLARGHNRRVVRADQDGREVDQHTLTGSRPRAP